MLNLRRAHRKTNAELREDPRIEFHVPATIIGVDANACIIDFSLGGFYIETDAAKVPTVGQRLNIALKLPNEKTGISVRAEVVYQAKDGFGCKLCDPSPDTMRVLERCFNIFSGTLPITITAEAGCHLTVA
ncbi:MAG: PilZ domain-containing protein [Desulfobacteraceae bacterium]|nr:PilZ domain-containing protein [Desulfobacteraceae bacterium]